MRASHIASIAAALCFSLTAAANSFAQSGDASTPVPGQAAAATHAGVSGFDVMTATVFQEGQSSFSGLSMRLRLRSRLLVPNVEFLPAVEYWRNRSNSDLLGGVTVTRSDATLGFAARWTFMRDHWQPYLGAGIAAHFLDEKVNAPSLGVNDQHDSIVKGGYSLHGGVNFTITEAISDFIELEYHGVTDYRQTKLHAGVSWNF